MMHPRPWRAILLFALLLLSTQTVLAWHEAQLDDHLAADHCQVCLHLSAVKHGAGPATALGIVPEFHATTPRELNRVEHLANPVSSSYQSRAPPAI